MAEITTTMAELQALDDWCEYGWDTLLAATDLHGGDFNKEFPLSAIIDSACLDDALWALRCKPEFSNLWRKYAVWCARKVQHWMKGERSIAALDVAWRHSDGQATDEELAAARSSAIAARGMIRSAAMAAAAATRNMAAEAAQVAAVSAGNAVRDAARSEADAKLAEERVTQSIKLREILTAGEWVA